MMELRLVEVPCSKDRRGRYSFPCINGLCPYNRCCEECYEYFDEDVRKLFDELLALRMSVVADRA